MRIISFLDGFQSSSAPTIFSIPASQIPVTPVGALSSTDAQSAFAELDSDLTTEINARIAADSTHAAASTGVHGVGAGAVVGTTLTQTLTNKTLTSPVLNSATTNSPVINNPLTNVESYTQQSSTPATPSAGVSKFYTKTDGNAYLLSPSGTETQVGAGGGGSKNYLSTVNNVNGNGNFETGSLGGWTYTACGAIVNSFPSGGIVFTGGGTPAVSVASTSPLAGTYSLSVNAVGSFNAQTGHASPIFTIDQEDQAKVLSFKFYYAATSYGQTINFSGTSASTFAVFIYDVTNSQWIQPSGCYGMTQGTGVGICTGTFQTASNGSQYRLGVMCVNASTYVAGSPNITMVYDDFSVGPQITAIGAVATDWQAYTPTSSWVTNTSVSGQWRRVGDVAEIRVRADLTGAPTATGLTFTLPPGLTANAAKLPNGNITAFAFDAGIYKSSSNLGYPATAYLASTTTLSIYSNAAGQVNATSPITFATGDWVVITASVPITGWSSNVQISNDTDTRVVAFSASLASNYSVTANNPIKYDTVISDTHGSYNPATGLYTVSTSGYFNVALTMDVQTASVAVYAAKNGTAQAYIAFAAGSGTVAVGSTLVKCAAGDTLSAVSNTTCVVNGGGAPYVNAISINRLSGPAVIAASESVNCRYINTSGFSVPNNASTTITGWTKDFDSHGFMTTGGVATLPVSGKFRVAVSLALASGAMSIGTEYEILVTQAGSVARTTYLGGFYGQAAVTAIVSINGSDTLGCLAGDTLSIQAYQNAGGARTLATTANQVHVTIEKVGN
jgi:hypothetical protein